MDRLGVVSSPFGRELGGKLLASSFGLRSLHTIHRVGKGSEVAVSLATRFAVELLLGVFLRAEDIGRITLIVGSTISVSDTDIKESSGSTVPEAVDGHVTSEVTWRGRVPLLLSSWSGCGLIGGNSWFISHSTRFEGFSTEHVPFPSNIIMSLENQAALTALDGVLHSEWEAAAVAAVG